MIKHLMLCFVALAFVGTPTSFASSSACSDGARLRLLDFLMLDANGGRLKSWDGASYIYQWVDEPGWDEVTLIDGYQISSCTCTSSRCSLRVDYQLSETNGQAQVIPHEHGGADSMVYDLIKVKGKGWKIREADAPRIYRHRYLIPAG